MGHINFQKSIQAAKWCRLETTGALNLDNELLKLVDDNLSFCHLSYQFSEKQENHLLTLDVSCRVNMQCQRCGETTNQPLKSHSTLMLSPRSNLDLENLAISLGFDLFVYNEQTSFLDVVREEIDLSMPSFPKCLTACKATTQRAKQSEPTQRPFAHLKAHLKSHLGK